MTVSVSDTLDYVFFLTRHVGRGDVQRVALVLLMELGFQVQSDGFIHLRRAICLKYLDQELRVNELYSQVGRSYHSEIGSSQVEQSIRLAISYAWANRDEEKWMYFFRNGKLKAPSNGEFIAELAYVIELWCNCGKEDYNAAK